METALIIGWLETLKTTLHPWPWAYTAVVLIMLLLMAGLANWITKRIFYKGCIMC